MEESTLQKRKRKSKIKLEKEFGKMSINKKEKKRRKDRELKERKSKELLHSLDLSFSSGTRRMRRKILRKLDTKRKISKEKEFQLSDSYSYSTESENEISCGSPFDITNKFKIIGLGQLLEQNDDEDASEGNSVIDHHSKNNLSFENINNRIDSFPFLSPTSHEYNQNLRMKKKYFSKFFFFLKCNFSFF